MFKFATIMSGGKEWVDTLYMDDKHIGTIGLDEEGIYLKIKQPLSLQEINLLIAQLSIKNPQLLKEKLEIILLKEE